MRCLQHSSWSCLTYLNSTKEQNSWWLLLHWPLTMTEQKYSVGEREAPACVWACETWNMYLNGCPFTLWTDHHADMLLLNTSSSDHRPLPLYRWTERLQACNLTIQFTPGSDNVLADLPSRATPNPPPETSQGSLEPQLILMHSSLVSSYSHRAPGCIGTGFHVLPTLHFYSQRLAGKGVTWIDCFSQGWGMLEQCVYSWGTLHSGSHSFESSHFRHGALKSSGCHKSETALQRCCLVARY